MPKSKLIHVSKRVPNIYNYRFSQVIDSLDIYIHLSIILKKYVLILLQNLPYLLYPCAPNPPPPQGTNIIPGKLIP